ncbi:BTAD domain-containing putative transcriptional regulator [Streptomyces sp. NPDC006552]|uniref:BTAD domain-containing putative transcriptional regulator n=1 Tax=Streptomyces sp. NPDC006552 TaxID=3157179 RepID=UPI0033BC3A66
MEFRILGSLQASVDGTAVPIGGVIKRRLLACLLLNANRVVATHKLLDVLWPDETPRTARKMIGNAVRGLRLDLAQGDPDARAHLLTRAPGYQLRVDPQAVDLFRFREAVEQGRAEAGADRHTAAARTLREALGLWRGAALADMAEDGLNWPELAGLESERLSAFEEYTESGLAVGDHHEVLRPLQQAVAENPLRERLSAQLMLALYRCGRQTEALSVFRRIRHELVEEYGLEPSRELQELERAILAHADSLEGPASPAVERRRMPERLRVASLVARQPACQPADAPGDAPASRTVSLMDPGHRRHSTEFGCRRVSVVLLWVRHDLADEQGADGVQRILADAEAVLRQESARYGGLVASAAPLFCAVFGADDSHRDDATRAVRAAFALLERLGGGRPAADAPGVQVNVAVATGQALLSPPAGSGGDLTVTGGALDRGLRLVTMAPRGQVRVCEETRRATEAGITYHVGPEPPEGWEAVRVRPAAVHELDDMRPVAPNGPEVLGTSTARSRRRGAGSG